MTAWIFPFHQTYVLIKNIIILYILCFLNITLSYHSVVSYSMYVKECLCEVQLWQQERFLMLTQISKSTKVEVTLLDQEPVVN